MKSKWNLVGAIVQLVFGALAIVIFIILLISGENMARWTTTLLLAVAFVILGIIGIIDYKSKK